LIKKFKSNYIILKYNEKHGAVLITFNITILIAIKYGFDISCIDIGGICGGGA